MLAMVKSGSRNETKTEKGLAHFCEHMVFKGGKKFKNAQSIASAIDNVGGELNAYTSEEITAYYVKVAKEFIETGLDVLEDLVIYPQFQEAEIEKEKGVIIEEINMYEDMPKSKAQMELAAIIYPHHPLGWPIAGEKKTILGINRDNFKQYHHKMYCGENLVVILAGAVKEQDWQKVEKRFSGVPLGQIATTEKPLENQIKPKPKITNKKSEQTHLAFGFRSIPLADPNRFAHKILAVILGGSMSSRLFVNLREKQGLCYYIQANTETFTDSGYFNIAAGVDNSRALIAIKSIIEEVAKISHREITDQELKKAKELMIGRMKLNLEDSEQIAEYFITQEVLENQIQTPIQVAEQIRSVSKKQIKKLAEKIFQAKQVNLSWVGPKQDEEKILDLLQNLR